MNNKIAGAMLALAVVAALAIAPCAVSADSADIREAELYAGSAFVYTPSGDWTGAKASGSALGAGLEWADGTLSGKISEPGAYEAAIEKEGKTLRISLNVVPAPEGPAYAGDPSEKPADAALAGFRASGDGRSVIVSAAVAGAEKIYYNWGDGTWTILPVESALQQAQHAYRQGGAYTVTVKAEGPYSSGYAAAMYDAPAVGSDGKAVGGVMVSVLLAMLAVAALAGFLITWDRRLAIVAAIIGIAAFLMLLHSMEVLL